MGKKLMCYCSKRKHVCPVCRQTFKTNEELSTHIATHHIKYLCHVCGKGFTTSTNLYKHQRNIHNQREQDTAVFCEQCNTRFSRKDNLKRHITSFHQSNSAT